MTARSLWLISCNDVTPGTICGADLGKMLKVKPKVFTQCPEPGSPPGTCTMHTSWVDLAPVLASLGLIGNPPTANVLVPTPNHSHVLDDDDINLNAEWWQ